MVWHVIFYEDKNGQEPVKDFILYQSYEGCAEILHVFDLLYKFDLSLGKPYIEKINGKIWALMKRQELPAVSAAGMNCPKRCI